MTAAPGPGLFRLAHRGRQDLLLRASTPTSRSPGIQSIDNKLYYFDANGVQQDATFGIDVSKYQSNIDWEQVKTAGVNFVIIRIGYRGYG